MTASRSAAACRYLAHSPRIFDVRLAATAVLLCCLSTAASAQAVDADSLARPAQERPVTYAATDSLVVLLADRDSVEAGDQPDDRVALYGDVTARYGEATLSAGIIELALGRDEVRARPADGAQSLPRFSEGADGFTGREIVYNFASRRGRVVGARTEIEGGFLLGGVVKQVAPDIVFAAHAGYMTCDLDHPHYELVAGRLKVEDEHVYTGPVQLRILGLPTPLWLPFGYFPAREGRRSGPLPPGYGEDNSFGFYLQNLGYYWAASDYFDLLGRLKAGTRGSLQLDAAANYVRRYRYDGALSVQVARLRRGEREDPDFTLSNNMRLMWRHQQTLSPEARLSSAVDLSSSAQRFLSDRYDDRVAQTSTSTVSFARQWPRAGRQLGVDLRATQQLTSGGIDATVPSLSFSQGRLFPFRRGPAGQDDGWFERISVSYNGAASSTYRFAPRPDSLRPGFEDVSWIDALFDHDAFVGATGERIRFRPQVTHAVPISASYTVSRLPLLGPARINLAPSIRYSESWFARSERLAIDTAGTVVRMDVPGFTAIRRLVSGVSANTEMYGIFPFRLGPYTGLRHVLRPQVAFEFEPDYESFGYIRSYTDAEGRTVRYPIAGGVPVQRTARLGFTLGNALQTRRVRPDSTVEGGERRETIQVLALNLRSAYDFAARERPLADLSFDLASELGERFRLRLDGTASAYALDSLGRVTTMTYWSDAGFPLRTTRLSLAFGTAFRGRPRRSDPSPLPAGHGTAASPLGIGDPLTGERPLGLEAGASPPGTSSLGVMDRGVPWSFALDMTYSYSPATGLSPARHEAVLSLSRFELGLPFGLHVTGATGLDLVRFDLATTQLQLVKDLHCWEARLNVVPFGAFRQIGFAIYVKSGFLRDLLRLDFARGGVSTPLGGF